MNVQEMQKDKPISYLSIGVPEGEERHYISFLDARTTDFGKFRITGQ